MIIDLAFSQDGARLYSCSRDKTTRIWDSASGQCLQTIVGQINCSEMVEQQRPWFAFARDWETVIISRDGQELAFFPDALQPGQFIQPQVLAGRGNTAPGYIYILELPNLDRILSNIQT